MKSKSITASIVSLFLLVASSAFVSAQNQSSTMNNGARLTPAEVKVLSSQAKTPQDHLALAAYFRNEASQAESMAKLHEEMLSGYKADPVAGTTTELQMHSQEFVDSARRAAASANEMAKEHEEMAAQLQQRDTSATK
jgi:hypothetical protein